jgi:hypothetical protein
VYVDGGSFSKTNRPSASVLACRIANAPANGPEAAGNPSKSTEAATMASPVSCRRTSPPIEASPVSGMTAAIRAGGAGGAGGGGACLAALSSPIRINALDVIRMVSP